MQNKLPFSYYWIIKRSLFGAKLKTILDLGCGNGELGDLINNQQKYKLTGVDIFDPYLNVCKRKGKYQKLMKFDLSQKLPFKSRSYDAVVCLQVLEHLPFKKANMLIKECERLAKHTVIISTPMGESIQEEYDDNKFQRHLSIWYPGIFTQLGYDVVGNGLKIIYGNKSLATEKINLFKIPKYLTSFLMNPLVYFVPSLSCQIIAKKIILSKPYVKKSS